jgi:hypothetical protein
MAQRASSVAATAAPQAKAFLTCAAAGSTPTERQTDGLRPFVDQNAAMLSMLSTPCTPATGKPLPVPGYW